MDEFKMRNFSVYRSVFEYIDANMFVLIKNQKALIIDPHENAEIFALLRENKVSEITILLTHEHADHTSGIKWLKRHFKTNLIASKETSNYLSNPKNARPILINFILEERDRLNGTNFLQEFQQKYEPFVGRADIEFDGEFTHFWDEHELKFTSICGHSKGSCCIILDDELIFTGDSLMKNYPIITRFPGGSKKDYENFTLPFFERLDPNLKVFAGHGEIFELKECFKDGKINVEFR